ncbi:SNF2 family N-terminal domain-containing protein [Aspergillus egyptiacus]|nr:SNF2 family N-terminal domain-containing protein [Aspergillus egyptiacus]
MSLKRLLNPTSDQEDQNHDGNLWSEPDPRVRPRLDWSMESSEMNPDAFSCQLPGDPDSMFMGVFNSGDISNIFDDTSFLQLASENAFLSETLLMSTPLQTIDEQDGNADILMADTVDVDPPELDDQICYGMLVHEKVKLLGKGQELQEKISKLIQSNPSRSHTFPIKPSSNGELFLMFPDGTSLGHLSEKMVRALKHLADRPQSELEALADLSQIAHAIRRTRKATDAVVRVNVNIYGRESDRDRIGKVFSDHNLFLQPPEVCRPGLKYSNPQMLRLEGMDSLVIEEDGSSEEEEGATHSPSERDADFEETMAEVYDGLTRGDGLTRLEGGENLNKDLYQHQEEALTFMMQRETGDIPDKYRLWQPRMVDGEELYCHVITKTQDREQPDESGGGILADEMGMGKSLTTLVLVGKTLGEAYQWAEERRRLLNSSFSETPCRATLVIVPSRVLINTHLKSSLKLLPYHGRSRKDYVSSIEHHDIVITTYNTLAKEHAAKELGRGKSPLHDFAWYRVVLDEAHMIRRRETTFHKAVVELQAKSRWCLSGTPIQNSLADLGSLLAFIQVRPFHDLRNFRHWIAYPFDSKQTRRRAIRHLTVLLDAICLRRTKEKVDLPEPQQETHIVRFTPQERSQYEHTRSGMQRYLIQQAGEYNQRASRFGMFQVFQQLRSFCNHGTYQPRFSWAKRNLLIEEEDSVRSLTRDSWDRCSGCRQPLPIVHRDRRPRYVENCNHVLCEECSRGSNTRPGPNERLHCPWCEFLRGPNAEDRVQDHRLLLEGYSSKMQVLVADVSQDLEKTKSIIFSCWTRTLDLIGRHLESAEISFARIDGKTVSSRRQEILDRFDRTRDVPVLIMTTGTGAFGLNLQSVNRVFIVEPQWNPSVESQAIARAVRLGQTQRVLVTRYRVEDSIEEDMCSQQMQKLKISKFDFEKDLQLIRRDSATVVDEDAQGMLHNI